MLWKKRSRHYPGTSPAGLKKITRNDIQDGRCPDRGPMPGTPEHESQMLPPEPAYSVDWIGPRTGLDVEE
jgi:hypothetical protein